MTKNLSRKLLKAFVLIVVIRIHVSKWEVVIVCRSRTPRGMRIILFQVIQFHFGKWEVAVVYRSLGGVGIFDNPPKLPLPDVLVFVLIASISTGPPNYA